MPTGQIIYVGWTAHYFSLSRNYSQTILEGKEALAWVGIPHSINLYPTLFAFTFTVSNPPILFT